MEKTYQKKTTGFMVLCWILAIICIPLIVTIPFALAILYIAYKPYVKIADGTLFIKWFGTREIPLDDIEEWKKAPGGGLIGGLMSPVLYKRKSTGKWEQVALGIFEDHRVLRKELSELTGASVPGAAE